MRRDRTQLNMRRRFVSRRKRSPTEFPQSDNGGKVSGNEPNGNSAKRAGNERWVGNWRERDWEWERMDAIRLETREDARRVLGSVILERIRPMSSSGRRVGSGSE